MRSTLQRSMSADALRALVAPHLVAMGQLAARLTSTADRDHIVRAAVTVAAREPARHGKRAVSTQAWLLGLVADRAQRYRPRRQGEPSELIDVAPETLDLERWGDLDIAVASLAWKPRLALELFYVLGLDLAECAAVMGLDVQAVTSTLAAARRTLIDGVDEIELS